MGTAEAKTLRSVALVGLGRDLCGATFKQLATLTDLSPGKIRHLYELHRSELEKASTFSHHVHSLAAAAIDPWRAV